MDWTSSIEDTKTALSKIDVTISSRAQTAVNGYQSHYGVAEPLLETIQTVLGQREGDAYRMSGVLEVNPKSGAAGASYAAGGKDGQGVDKQHGYASSVNFACVEPNDLQGQYREYRHLPLCTARNAEYCLGTSSNFAFMHPPGKPLIFKQMYGIPHNWNGWAEVQASYGFEFPDLPVPPC